MEVIKRDGKSEKVSFDKITKRLSVLCEELDEKVDPILIAQETIKGMYNRISTQELDILSADICANKIHHHPDFNKLASRILISNLHKSTEEDYLKVVSVLYENKLVSDGFYEFVKAHYREIQILFDYSRDYLFDYFGFKTLERSYLYKVYNNEKFKIVERPQHMWMRIAIQIHGLDQSTDNEFERMVNIQNTYTGLSNMYFTHATPTLFNAGSPRPQMSSCFLMTCFDDLENIFKNISDISQISKFAGGIGISLTNIRAKGSIIHSTNGKSEGIIPLCKVLESVARYVTQGGKRNGSIACYLEPWHADVFEFVELRKNIGDENLRARDLFLAIYANDIFMERVLADGDWSLMCPDECTGLVDTFGKEFTILYEKYEREGKAKRTVKARDLWRNILEMQIETGMPYLVYKDHLNNKNSHKNLGTVTCSNLCSEITLYSNKNQQAVCNLGSLCLPKFINSDGSYNYKKLGEITEILTVNLNKVIDLNYYPTPETRLSNNLHRPIGIGVQGLADVYCKLGISFESDEARILNKKIFECIYYHSLKASCKLAEKYGTYSSYRGSPFYYGVLQCDMWTEQEIVYSEEFDWNGLRKNIQIYGLRNSHLTALMPTASTSQIMGNSECFEPITSNIYVRKTLAGEFIVVNENLVRDLIREDLWNKEMYEEILFHNGSVQMINRIPKKLREIYKTAYEIKGINILRQAVERGPFIDQTQSMNIFMAQPSFDKLSSSHFYGWKNGLKTGMYYLRTQPAVDPIKFGLDATTIKRLKNKKNDDSPVCVFVRKGQKPPEGCDVCSA